MPSLHMKRTIVIILTIVLICAVLSWIDIRRFAEGADPLFVVYQTTYTDGGSTFSYGPGYQLIDWHILGFDEEHHGTYYSVAKEYRVFPMFRYSYEHGDLDTSEFEIVYE